MNCAYHQSHVACGICKQCYRALCEICISPDLESIACKNRCEQKLIAVEKIINRATGNKIDPLAVLFVCVSMMLLVIGVDFIKDDNIITGTVFIVVGLTYIIVLTLPLFKKLKKNNVR